MKKRGISSRILSLLLALVMVLSILPVSAFAAVGDKEDGDTGLKDNAISSDDTISLPIKIYDYEGDGMLFEYAEAQDTGYSYGGYAEGASMPYTYIGNDYTVIQNPNSDDGDVYSEKAYTYWLKGSGVSSTNSDAAGVECEVYPVESVSGTSPAYLHVEYTVDNNTKFRAWVSDFYNDNDEFYTKEEVRYAVIVYRTNSSYTNGAAAFSWGLNYALTSSSLKTLNGEGDGNNFTVQKSTDWTYKVVDMKVGNIATNWDSISGDVVSGIKFMFPMNAQGESMDISHIAYFSTEESAASYGEAAVAFDNNPGIDLSKSYYGGEAVPTVQNGLDFTTDADYSSNAVAIMTSSSVGMTVTKYQTGAGVYFARISNTDSWQQDYCTVTDFANDQDCTVSKADVQYAVLVYRTPTTLDYSTVKFYLNGSTSNVTSSLALETTVNWSWKYTVFPLTGAANWSSLDRISTIGMYWPGFDGDETQYIDISHLAFFSTSAEAAAFGAAAVAFDRNPGTYDSDGRGWNMGNNRAFGLLRGSNGGGFSTTDDNYSMTNSYSSKYIGYRYYQGGSNWAGTKEDQIYYINMYDTSATTLDMSGIDFDGYNLLQTVMDGQTLFTAGMVEGTLNDDKTVQYREETINYVAKTLQSALSIPEIDKYGGYNYNFVSGAKIDTNGDGKIDSSDTDLATAIRACVGIDLTNVTYDSSNRLIASGELGDYATTYAKKESLVGAWSEVQGSVKTCYDAAYYLLNNIFVSGSYNTEQDDYDYLVLNKATTDDSTNGVTEYVFDAGFTVDDATAATSHSAVYYDTANNTISLKGVNGVDLSTVYKTLYYYEGSALTTYFPFLPVHNTEASGDLTMTDGTIAVAASAGTNISQDKTVSPYFRDTGVVNDDKGGGSYTNSNFNYVMVSNGEFVYHEEDELFFEFEGDDDVYLFINGQLVLDIGGAHSIAKVKMNLNDYVTAARAAVDAGSSDARDQALALVDGESYDFDFYYMERHGYGANFRIATNIRVTDPAVKTEKTAYQDGGEIEYGGMVNKDDPIEYCFSLTNTGNSKLYCLSFSDSDIGLTLDYEKGMVIQGTNGERVCDVNGETLEVTDLVAYVDGYDEDGNPTATITVTFADEAALKAFLKTLQADGTGTGEESGTNSGSGLWVGSTVTIRGFAYKMTDEQKTAGVFDNTVTTNANTQSDGGGKSLSGNDSHRVYIAAEPMYYQWANHALNVTLDKLVTDILSAASNKDNVLNGKVPNLSKNVVTNVALCTKLGNPISYGSNVVVNSDKSLTIQYAETGSPVFYIKLTYTNGSTAQDVIVPVLVNVTDVADSYIVLDYGLKAELTKDGAEKDASELFKNDTLNVPARATAYTIQGIAAENSNPTYGVTKQNQIYFQAESSNYIKCDDGDYELSGDVLSYKPTEFMEEYDTIWFAVTVHEKDFTASALNVADIDINNEVQMYKSVTTLPATVVYYEDYFPSINYQGGTNTFEPVDAPSQGVDQDQEYGQDEAYQNNSDKSAGTIATITIEETGPAAYFTFKGTGFELISRTNATDSATIVVEVYDLGTDGTVTYDEANSELKINNGTLVKLIPVITEFDNGADGGTEEIYQVPVIRVDDLGTMVTDDDGNITSIKAGRFAVVIKGIASSSGRNKLYIDGLRIFQPLGSTNKYYNDNESGATFTEIRDLIIEGEVAVADYDGDVTNISTATTTWTENRNGTLWDGATYTGNEVYGVEDYLVLGPNNEVYMDGSFTNNALVFYVKENADSTVHNLQIAVHAVDESLFYGTGAKGMNAAIQYGVKLDDGNYAWKPLVTVTSGTEQYYTIPYAECPKDESGRYLIAIKVDDVDNSDILAMASFTSLKYNGLTIQSINGDRTTLYYRNGVLYDAGTDGVIDDNDALADPENYVGFPMVSLLMMSRLIAMPDEVEPDDTDTDPDIDNDTDTDPDAPITPITPVKPSTTITTTGGSKNESTNDTANTGSAMDFSDVTANDWFKPAVDFVSGRGLMNGVDANTFGPHLTTTRAMVWTILARLDGVDTSGGSPWYEKGRDWAMKSGVSDGTNPDGAITREQLATMLWRQSGSPAVSGDLSQFTDAAQASDWAETALVWAVKNGVLSGMGDGTLNPGGNATRAQVAQMLKNYLTKIGD